jgi:mRNA-degrading endonuclease RelE of RelBE toxin-antitoxin system
MSFKIVVTSYFSKQLKRLIKKFPSLKDEFQHLLLSLNQNPEQGTKLNNNCYKLRIAIKSKRKGKSGGARIITHIQFIDSTLYLISIYDKSEKETISEKELEEMIKLLV